MKTRELVDTKLTLECNKEVDRDFWDSVFCLVRDLLPMEEDDIWYANNAMLIIKNNVGNDLVNKKGKIAKRIANETKKTAGVKLSGDIVQAIGNIAYQNTLNSGNYTLLFDQNMETSGNFGDDGSCFMKRGCNRHHFEAMQEDGDYLVLKIWKGSKSFARCWVYVENDDTMLFFNAYGLKMHNIVSIFRQISPEFVNVHSNYRLDVWDNNDGQVLSRDKDHKKRIYAPCDIGEMYTCYGCDSLVDEDESIYSESTGETYCEECYNELFFYCDSCGQDHEREEVEEVQVIMWRNGNRWSGYVCEECAREQGYYKCDQCGEWSGDYHIVDDETYCEDCYSDNCFFCEVCEEYQLLDSGERVTIDHLDIDDQFVCHDCLRDVDTCEICGEYCENSPCENCQENLPKQIDIYGNDCINIIHEDEKTCPDCIVAADGGLILCSKHYNEIRFNEFVSNRWEYASYYRR